MQRNARAPDLFYQRFATRVDFVQVRRTKWLLSRSRKHEVSHLEIANGPIVCCCERVEFLGDTQRRLANFVVGTDVSDDDWINRIAKKDERVIAHFNRIGAAGKRARHYDERIGRANQKTELFERANLCAQFGDCIAQVAFTGRRGTRQRKLVFFAF